MKVLTFIGLLMLTGFSPVSFAQGTLRNDGHMEFSLGYIVLSGNSGLINNGSIDCWGGSYLKFNGNALQTISGSNNFAAAGVVVDNSGPGVEVMLSFSVQGSVNMVTGDLDLRNSGIMFTPGASLLNETLAKRVKATDGAGNEGMGTGTLWVQMNNPTGNVCNFGLNFTPSAALGNSFVIRGHARQTGTGTFTGNSSICRYYEIRPTSASSITINNFNYFPVELNGHAEANLQMFQYVRYYWGTALGPLYWTPRASTPFPASDYVSSTTITTAHPYTRITLGSTVTPLPVELLNFSATCTGSLSEMHWQTASESNSSFFLLETSTDGYNYSECGVVSAQGNSNTSTDYNLKYEAPSSLHYARITGIDMDGVATILKTVTVVCGNNEFEESFSLAQQSGDNYIIIQGLANRKYTCSLTNELGQVVGSQTVVLDFSGQAFLLPQAPAAGMYYVVCKTDTWREAKPLIIAY